MLGNVKIDNSTVSGNTLVADHMTSPYGYGAAAGGVLGLPGSGTSIDHSTIAFNKVVGSPGGPIEIGGGLTSETQSILYNGNTYDFDASVVVRNTIIAKNTAGIGEPDVAGAFQSQGHNLLGVLGSGTGSFVASDLHGTPSAPLDPKLLPLGWYGGPTQTHLLAPDSPAINAGDSANAPSTDQRGRSRVVGGTIDIGAVERGPGDARYQAGPGGSNNANLAAALLDAIFGKLHDLLDWQQG